MAAPIVQIDYDRMQQISLRFQRLAERVSWLRQQLQQVAERLIAGAWQGAAAVKFANEYQTQLVPAIHRLSTVLNIAQELSLEVSGVIQSAEDEAARLFRSQLVLNQTTDQAAKYQAAYLDISEMRRVEGQLYVAGGADMRQGIHPSDADQGQIGDCFVVASLAAIAQHNPDVIRNAIEDNGDGSYTVTFYQRESNNRFNRLNNWLDNGYDQVKITVTAEFPVLADGTHPYIYENQEMLNGKRELWPAIMEKAYGQFLSQSSDPIEMYSTLNRGGNPADVLEAITGQPSVLADPKTYSMRQLAELHNSKQAIIFGTHEPENPLVNQAAFVNKHLQPKHAYYVSHVDQQRNRVSLRNPWSWNEPPIIVNYADLDQVFNSVVTNPID
ncbi:C2 family cysteine protease [Herpetosiphon sp. NSE202]|uniref:C2 family cysteine protease n=1 Tax=Herpetosiphon sp. NSE202 TaxID=3351349 RepID=UPI0036437B31